MTDKTTARDAETERYYVDAIWRVQQALKAGEPAENVFLQMGAEAELFNKALADGAFIAAAQKALKERLPWVTSASMGLAIDGRIAAQNRLLQLVEDPAFRTEVVARAAMPEITPVTPLKNEDPPLQLLLPEAVTEMLAFYRDSLQTEEPSRVINVLRINRQIDQALAETFGGADHVLETPLVAALERAGIAPHLQRSAADLADSFLSSRTKESEDRALLRAPNGWIMQQLGLEEKMVYEGRVAKGAHKNTGTPG